MVLIFNLIVLGTGDSEMNWVLLIGTQLKITGDFYINSKSSWWNFQWGHSSHGDSRENLPQGVWLHLGDLLQSLNRGYAVTWQPLQQLLSRALNGDAAQHRLFLSVGLAISAQDRLFLLWTITRALLVWQTFLTAQSKAVNLQNLSSFFLSFHKCETCTADSSLLVVTPNKSLTSQHLLLLTSAQ